MIFVYEDIYETKVETANSKKKYTAENRQKMVKSFESEIKRNHKKKILARPHRFF